PDARQRLDGVVTKGESLRDESCAAAWLWRDDDSHGAGGMRPSPFVSLVRSRNMGNISAGVGTWGSRPLNLPPLNIRKGPSGLRICGASLPELRPWHHDPRTSAAPACDASVGRPRRKVTAKGVGEVRPQIPFARGGALPNLFGLDPEPFQQLGQMPRGERPACGVLGPGPLVEPDQVANDGGRGELVGGAGGEEVLQIGQQLNGRRRV